MYFVRLFVFCVFFVFLLDVFVVIIIVIFFKHNFWSRDFGNSKCSRAIDSKERCSAEPCSKQKT
jgi:hypothetical protein